MPAERMRWAVVVITIVVFVLALVWSLAGGDSGAPAYSYSELLTDAAQGRVASIEQEGTQLTVSFVGQSETQSVQVASDSINVYAEVCAAANAELGSCPISYVAVEPSASGGVVTLLVTSLLPVLLIGGFIFFMMRGATRRGPPT